VRVLTYMYVCLLQAQRKAPQSGHKAIGFKLAAVKLPFPNLYVPFCLSYMSLRIGLIHSYIYLYIYICIFISIYTYELSLHTHLSL